MSTTNSIFNIPFQQPTNYDISSSAPVSTPYTPLPTSFYQLPNTLSNPVTTIIARRNTPPPSPSPISTIGIPGANYIPVNPPSVTFYQGEDFVFDAFLYYNSQTINTTQYVVHAVLKPSVYLVTPSWTGFIGNGIYLDPSNTAHFVILIPSSVTSSIIAGNFELDIYMVEIPGPNNVIKPLTVFLGKTQFNIEYAVFSPNPETVQQGYSDNRTSVLNSFPPSYAQAPTGISTYSEDGVVFGPVADL